MRLLLDTHILLWAFAAPDRLPRQAKILIEDASNSILFSVVSIWEIGIKVALDRPDFRSDPTAILNEARQVGFHETAITSPLAIAASRLPLLHRDPFDRMLVAQAISEPARLVTIDKVLQPYSELVLVL